MTEMLVVPLDGSQLAEQALPEARRIAGVTHASVLLVRAVPRGTAMTAMQDIPDESQPAIAEAAEYLHAMEQSLAEQGVTVRTEVIQEDAASAVVLAARTNHASMIVMSTHGRSGLSRAVLGSVADRVLHEAPVPLLLVRANHRSSVRRDGPYRRILIPLDDTLLAEQAVTYVASQAFARGAEIMLLYSEQPTPAAVAPAGEPGYLTTSVFQQIEEERERHRHSERERLEALAFRHLSGHTWQVFVTIGDPAESITHIARDQDVEIIAMTTHARAGLDRILHGSIASRVIHHADTPVLIPRAATGSEPN